MRWVTNVCALVALATVGFALGDWADHPNAIGLLGLIALVFALGFLMSVLLRDRPAAAAPAPDAPAAPAPVAPSAVDYQRPPPPPAPPGRVNLNRAGVAELASLPGVGPTAAQRIVDAREATGPFATVTDLARVPGFSPDKVRGLAGRARV